MSFTHMMWLNLWHLKCQISIWLTLNVKKGGLVSKSWINSKVLNIPHDSIWRCVTPSSAPQVGHDEMHHMWTTMKVHQITSWTNMVRCHTHYRLAWGGVTGELGLSSSCAASVVIACCHAPDSNVL
ncbi:hypothetical protein VNO77_16004 [Canavalia gladiata]|uniref:Uncharacterized protein n=1 Tax=Canavalia gladiata TaxID=3824 RepID=A0AAN9LZR7_CANGL